MSMQFQCQIWNSAKLEKETRAPKAPKVHYWRTGQWNIIISHGVSVRHSSPPTFIHSFGDLCRSSSRSSHVCMYIQGYRRGATRTRLTNCLCLSPAIFSPGYCFAECDRPTDRPNERTSSGRTDGRSERAAAARQHQQPARNITRPRSHGVYPPGPMLREISRTIRMPGRPRHSAGHSVSDP